MNACAKHRFKGSSIQGRRPSLTFEREGPDEALAGLHRYACSFYNGLPGLRESSFSGLSPHKSLRME